MKISLSDWGTLNVYVFQDVEKVICNNIEAKSTAHGIKSHFYTGWYLPSSNIQKSIMHTIDWFGLSWALDAEPIIIASSS